MAGPLHPLPIRASLVGQPSLTFALARMQMREMRTFRLRWEVRGKQHVTEMRAATAGDARQAFNTYRLPGVLLPSVEPVEPDAAVPPISTQPPDVPFSPLIARRKRSKDEDAR